MLYQSLGRLIESMPDLLTAWDTPEGRQWIGRASALIEASGSVFDSATFNVASNSLGSTTHVGNVQSMTSIVYRALAKAELAAPAASQGAFIPVGEAFSALAAVGKVIGAATQSILIIDPYADSNALTEFAVLAPEQVLVMVLTDAAAHKPGLRPATAAWTQQYAEVRPLEVCLAPARSLHDRLIIVDAREVWTLGQSLNHLAQRAPSSIVRVDPDTAKMKIAAYAAVWATASPL